MAGFLSILKWLVFTPAPPPPPHPDWSAIPDYYALSQAVDGVWPMTGEAFLDGPFTRYLEFCGTDDFPRARARAMEFATGTFRHLLREMAARGEPVEAFEARAWALVHQYLDDAPNGDYMIEVFEGRATHNYRAPVSETARDDSSTLPPPSPAL